MMKQYEQEVLSKEGLVEFTQELIEDGIDTFQVQRTGQGWVVYWIETEEA